MGIISDIYQTENVAVISFEKASAQINFISSLFKKMGEARINVDMISQTAPKGNHNTLSFTISDDDVAGVLSITASMKDENSAPLMPLVSVRNVKISLYGKEMPGHCGVAAEVFARLCESKIDTLLITTSDVDISVVVSRENADVAYSVLKESFILR